MNMQRASLFSAIVLAIITSAGCASMSDTGGVKLSGAQEVPAVTTTASGSSAIMVAADKSVSGSVKTSGIDGKAAHIHQGALGANGPVVVPLTKTADGMWSVPAGTTLTDAQYAAYQAGGMYVNVHSATNPGGEIRAQLSGK